MTRLAPRVSEPDVLLPRVFWRKRTSSCWPLSASCRIPPIRRPAAWLYRCGTLPFPSRVTNIVEGFRHRGKGGQGAVHEHRRGSGRGIVISTSDHADSVGVLPEASLSPGGEACHGLESDSRDRISPNAAEYLTPYSVAAAWAEATPYLPEKLSLHSRPLPHSDLLLTRAANLCFEFSPALVEPIDIAL